MILAGNLLKIATRTVLLWFSSRRWSLPVTVVVSTLLVVFLLVLFLLVKKSESWALTTNPVQKTI